MACSDPVGHKDRSINLNMYINFVKLNNHICVISVAVIMAVVEQCIFLLAFVVLENRRTTMYILISVYYLYRVLESVSRLTVWLHKGPLAFSILDSFFL